METGNGGPDVRVEFPDFRKLTRMRGRLPLGPIIAVVLLAVLVFTSFYTVEPEEIAVVLRFGKFVGIQQSGLNFKLPFGIDQVEKVPVERQLKEEFGFRTAEAGVRTEYSRQEYNGESLMLTGDLNIADVEWVVQYRIVDPFKYLFRVRNVQRTFRDMTEAVVREVVGDRTVNEVLTIGRQEIATLVEQRLQDLADQYETGLKVEQVVLQDVNPPNPVKPAFNEVNQAQQEREQKINAAQSAYNQVIPRARGEAQRTIEQAEGYALDRVNRAEGDASLFRSLYGEYRLAPEVTRRRIYLETMGEILPRAGRKLILDEDSQGVLPMLDLGSGGSAAGTAGAGVSQSSGGNG